ALVERLLARLHEAERTLGPGEKRVDDLQGLVLQAPPEIVRRDGAHLHQRLAVTHVRPDPQRGLVVLLLRDLAVAQQELAERIIRTVRGGENHLALQPVQCPLEPPLLEVQLAAAADHRDEAEHVGDLDAPEVPLENRAIVHFGPELTVPARIVRGTTSLTTSAARSTSSIVVKRLSEKRTVLFASSGDRPVASRTRLGWARPGEHAEPVDAATPFRSSPITIPSASAPRNVMLLVLGRRGAVAPLMTIGRSAR